MSDRILTCTGRYVSGDLINKVTKDYENRPIDLDKQQIKFGVAFPKTDPELPGMIQAIAAAAWTDFAHAPNIQQLISAGMQTYQFKGTGFSWKISDGDLPNSKGKIVDHNVGHYILWFSTAWTPKVVDQANAEMDPNLLKRGYYLDMAFYAVGNKLTNNQAGVFLNPEMLRFIGYGQEIVGGADADEVFAGRPVPTNMPAGASATPVAPGAMPAGVAQQPAPGQQHTAPGLPGGAPGMQQNAPLTTGYPGNAGVNPNPQAPAQQQQYVQPHGTFANGPQQAAPGMPGAAPGMPGAAPGMPMQQQPPQGMPGAAPGMPGTTSDVPF